jgi:hypothetical protein
VSRWGIGGGERAWDYPFGERSWAEIRSDLDEMAVGHPEFRYVADVADSVVGSGGDRLLAGSTSMHDLVVVPRPVGAHVRELIAVRAPGSLRPPSVVGHVRIEHLTSTGHDESIERPSAEAVPLFWRFVLEKYGIAPRHRSS